MAKLLKILNPEETQYRDRRFPGTEDEWLRALATTTTLYIGNLAFFTTEEQVYEVFSKLGRIRRIVMGLDKKTTTPCGFCFVEFFARSDALAALAYVNGTLLDERPVRVDLDWGYVPGRQYGRGRSGGQVRDEYRVDYDAGRGGYGKVVAAQMSAFSAAQAAAYSQMNADGLDAMQTDEAGEADQADVPLPVEPEVQDAFSPLPPAGGGKRARTVA